MSKNSIKNNLFRHRRRAFYRFFGKGKYKTHSQYVYNLYTQCLKPYGSVDLDNYVYIIEKFIGEQAIKSDYEIVRDINSSTKQYEEWRNKVAQHTGLSVETYRLGIIFFSADFAKQAHVLRW